MIVHTHTERTMIAVGMIIFALASCGFAGTPEEDADALIRWFHEEYVQKLHPYDAHLRARVALFEEDGDNVKSFLARLDGLRGNSPHALAVASLCGFFWDGSIPGRIEKRIGEIKDDSLRCSLLQALYIHRDWKYRPHKDLLRSLLREGDENVKMLVLTISARAYGALGADIYEAAFDDGSEIVRWDAFHYAASKGAVRARGAAKAWLRKQIEALDTEMFHSRSDIRECIAFLEMAYEIGSPHTPPATLREYAMRLIDVTDAIDRAVEASRSEYGETGVRPENSVLPGTDAR